MISFPRCKINIGLHILEKRPDGYHNIETLFYPLGLTDGLEIISSNGNTEFNQSGLPLPQDEKSNLVIKAYDLMKKDYDLPPVKIHLHKKIPPGSGLGGGSSNAANTLLLLNQIFHLGLSDEELAGYAGKLGADCAFFVYNKPMIGKNIGEVFDDVDVDMKGYYIAVVKSDIHVDTKDAYSKVIPEKSRKSLKELISQPISKWKGTIENDFEKTVFKEYPGIEKVKSALFRKGAVYASMTGSGSAVFGIFEHDPASLEKVFGEYLVWKERVEG